MRKRHAQSSQPRWTEKATVASGTSPVPKARSCQHKCAAELRVPSQALRLPQPLGEKQYLYWFLKDEADFARQVLAGCRGGRVGGWEGVFFQPKSGNSALLVFLFLRSTGRLVHPPVCCGRQQVFCYGNKRRK